MRTLICLPCTLTDSFAPVSSQPSAQSRMWALYRYRAHTRDLDICMWASLKKQAIVITGDLNLDRLRPDRREGKILLDLEEVHDLQCLITKPTRITPTSETLLDVILTTKPQLFKQCGAIHPEISDHHLIYGIITQSVHQHRRKTCPSGTSKKSTRTCLTMTS